jgi:hypothetical protein
MVWATTALQSSRALNARSDAFAEPTPDRGAIQGYGSIERPGCSRDCLFPGKHGLKIRGKRARRDRSGIRRGLEGPVLSSCNVGGGSEALAKLGGKAQCVHSYVADNKTFCVYLAENLAA